VTGGGSEARQLLATWALLKLVASEASIASGSAKRYFHRARPYTIDPSVRCCGVNAGVVLPTSYPSGHATLDYSIGRTLATLLPKRPGSSRRAPANMPSTASSAASITAPTSKAATSPGWSWRHSCSPHPRCRR